MLPWRFCQLCKFMKDFLRNFQIHVFENWVRPRCRPGPSPAIALHVHSRFSSFEHNAPILLKWSTQMSAMISNLQICTVSSASGSRMEKKNPTNTTKPLRAKANQPTSAGIRARFDISQLNVNCSWISVIRF